MLCNWLCLNKFWFFSAISCQRKALGICPACFQVTADFLLGYIVGKTICKFNLVNIAFRA